MSIFPYVYYMVQNFRVTQDDKAIAVYAGLVTSSFAFAEFLGGIFWGRLSDKIGRKPVLLSGLAGTALSMMVFGFAPSLPVALLARALGGLLNGNIGVLQTTVAEMVQVKEHQPRAYTIMPFVWCLGSILGPTLGGALAEPCLSYPSIFSRGTIFDRFPYLLPNLICTLILIVGVAIGMLFLEETHALKKGRRDVGLEIGDWLLRSMRRSNPSGYEKLAPDELTSLASGDEQPPDYLEGLAFSSRESQDTQILYVEEQHELRLQKPTFSFTDAFTRPVILNIVGYGILAYHTMTFDQMMPVFLSTPDEHGPYSLPFKFTGGYGLSTKQVGLILSAQGVYAMIAQLSLFPIVVRRLGPLGTFRMIACCYPVLYFLTPYLLLLPSHSLRMAGVYAILIFKITLFTLSYPSNAILMANSAPSFLALGTINGAAASTASLARAFGPTLSGLLYSTGLKIGYSGLAWWCSAIIAITGLMLSMCQADGQSRLDEKVPEDIEDHEGLPLDHPLEHSPLDEAIAAADIMMDRREDIGV